MLRAFRVLRFDVGKEFEVLTVSFNPREDAASPDRPRSLMIRRYKRRGLLRRLAFPDGRPGLHRPPHEGSGFSIPLRCAEKPICARWRHHGIDATSAACRADFYGIEFAPKDLRLGLH